MSERPRDSSDGLMRAAGFVVMAILAAGLVAGLTRGRQSTPKKTPLAKGSTPPTHVRGVSRTDVEAVPASAAFEVHRSVRADDGSVVIYGLTHNLSEVSVNPPKLEVAFKDADGGIVKAEETLWPFDLGPRGMVPTRLVYSRIPPYQDIEVKVVVTERVGLPASDKLVAESINTEPGQAAWTVSGKAANRGTADARWLKVVVAAYGPEDRVTWVGTRSLDVDTLAPGEVADFSMRVFQGDLPTKEPRFEAQVFGRER